MKVMMLFMGTADEATGDPGGDGRAHAAIGRWWGQHAADGTIIGGEQLAGPSTARKVELTPDGPVVTDGPFAEASEVVGGFALLEVPQHRGRGRPGQDMARYRPGGGAPGHRHVTELLADGQDLAGAAAHPDRDGSSSLRVGSCRRCGP